MTLFCSVEREKWKEGYKQGLYIIGKKGITEKKKSIFCGYCCVLGINVEYTAAPTGCLTGQAHWAAIRKDIWWVHLACMH